jgi:hypothetical protein
MEPAHIPYQKGRQGLGLAGHLTVTLLPVGDLAAYQAKTAHDVFPNAFPVRFPTTTKLPAKNKKKAGKWTLWTLWFNMYRCMSLMSHLAAFLTLLPILFTRKLFTIVVALNAVGIAFAASGHFQYAEKWTRAMALGNLNCAILMRNELFGRSLYLFVNTFFAKVTTPGFSPLLVPVLIDHQWTPLWWRLGCTSVLQVL